MADASSDAVDTGTELTAAGSTEVNPPARRDIVVCCCDGEGTTEEEKAMLALYLLEYRRRRIYEFSEECLTEHIWISPDKTSAGIPLRHKHEFKSLRSIAKIGADDKDSLRLAIFPSANSEDERRIKEIWQKLHLPVLINGKNSKDKQLVKDAGGGLWYDNYYEFEGALDYILCDGIRAAKLGAAGFDHIKMQ